MSTYLGGLSSSWELYLLDSKSSHDLRKKVWLKTEEINVTKVTALNLGESVVVVPLLGHW